MLNSSEGIAGFTLAKFILTWPIVCKVTYVHNYVSICTLTVM